MKHLFNTLFLSIILCAFALTASGQESKVNVQSEQASTSITTDTTVAKPKKAMNRLTVGGYGEAVGSRMFYSNNYKRYTDASLYKNDDIKRGHAIFPNALKNGKCEFFAPLRIVKMAWGFDKLFAEVKVKDAPLLRSEMRSYLGSKGQYYRYKLGQQKLLPEQQEHIKQLFARFGYKDVDFEYFAEEIDFTSI